MDKKIRGTLKQKALAHLEQDELNDVITVCRQIIDLQSDDDIAADAYHYRGIAYSKKNLYDRAIKDFNQALALNPDDVDAYYDRGLTYLKKSIYHEALADFDKVITLKPDDARRIIHNCVIILQAQESQKDAQKQSSQINPVLSPDTKPSYEEKGELDIGKGFIKYSHSKKEYGKSFINNSSWQLRQSFLSLIKKHPILSLLSFILLSILIYLIFSDRELALQFLKFLSK